MRNKQKKIDKIVVTEKKAKKGEITLTDAQKEMIAGKAELQKECKEIQAQLDLYIKSNPDCLKVGSEPVAAPKVVVVEQKPVACNDETLLQAVTIVFKCLKVKENKRATSGQKKALEVLQNGQPDMLVKLAQKSDESIVEGGVSYFNFYDWIEVAYKDMMLEEDSDDMGDVCAAMADDFDVFDMCDDFPVAAAPAKKEEPKPVVVAKVVEEVKKETPKAEVAEVKVATENAEVAETEYRGEPRRGGRGDFRGNDRGRGERGRGGRGRGRGDFRGGFNSQFPQEDADGFVEKTEKVIKPRRGDFRGGRGDRGDRGGDRGGDRRGGNRGEFRGEYRGRTEIGSARGGQRPQTAGATQPVEQQQQQMNELQTEQ